MSSALQVGIAGATGALGGELLKVLDAAPWRPGAVQAFARASSKVSRLRYGDDDLPVDNLDDLSPDGLDGLFVALPREPAKAVTALALDAGTPVIDASGATLADLSVPLVLPWVNAIVLRQAQARDVIAVPAAPAVLLATLLAPIAQQHPDLRASATVMVSASHWGRDASDELSRQVVALFNHGNPPRKVFPQGLAFDLLPEVSDTGVSGWTADEVRAAAEVARIAGARCDVSLVGVPMFTGIGAHLRLQAEGIDVAEVAQLLDAAGVKVTAAGGRRTPRPRRVDGSHAVHVARLRRGQDGAVHLWAAADGLLLAARAMVGALALRLQVDDPSL